jgi:hypothetical protein
MNFEFAIQFFRILQFPEILAGILADLADIFADLADILADFADTLSDFADFALRVLQILLHVCTNI